MTDSVPDTLTGQTHLAGDAKDYGLVWNDEFTGDHLDTKKWSIGLPWKGKEDGHWHNNEYASYITDDSVVVSDGSLHLLCQKREIKGKTRTFHYTEGFIHTSGKYSFIYGYAEARCQAPMDQGPGMWPAFWTLTKGWPPEFDVIELWSAEPRIHQGYAYSLGHGTKWASYHADGVSPRGYHVYAEEWGPGFVFFSIDGHVNNRVFGDIVTSKAEYLVLNSGIVNDPRHNPTDQTIFPNSFDVDYCRVYQRKIAAPIVHNPGFEEADLRPWTVSKGAGLSDHDAHGGTHALSLTAGASATQKIYGLKPNASYILSVWTRTNQARIRLSVTESGPESATITGKFDAFEKTQLRFKTGNQNTATISLACEKDQPGTAWFDDVSIEAANPN